MWPCLRRPQPQPVAVGTATRSAAIARTSPPTGNGEPLLLNLASTEARLHGARGRRGERRTARRALTGDDSVEQRTRNRVEQRVGVDVRPPVRRGRPPGNDTGEMDAHLVLEPVDDRRPQLWVVMQVGQKPRNCCLRLGASVRPQRPADHRSQVGGEVASVGNERTVRIGEDGGVDEVHLRRPAPVDGRPRDPSRVSRDELEAQACVADLDEQLTSGGKHVAIDAWIARSAGEELGSGVVRGGFGFRVRHGAQYDSLSLTPD